MSASSRPGRDDDVALACLLEELSQRLATGEAIELESYCRRFPQYAEELRSLMPVLERLAALHRTDQTTGEGGSPQNAGTAED